MWSLIDGKPVLLDTNTDKLLYTKQFDANAPSPTSVVMTDKEFRLAFPKKTWEQIQKLKLNPNPFEQETINRFPKKHFFTSGTNFIPALGYKDSWDGHIYIAGSTGCGKSFIIQQMLLHDKKKRPIFLFTDLQERDISFKEIFATKRMKRVKMDGKKFDQEIDVTLEEMEVVKEREKTKKGIILVFDDIAPSEKHIIAFRDRILEKGRHRNVTAIVVNHQMRQYGTTKAPLNDSEYIVAFPSSNRSQVAGFLIDFYRLSVKKVTTILNIAEDDHSRHLIIHLQSPNFLSTTQSAIII